MIPVGCVLFLGNVFRSGKLGGVAFAIPLAFPLLCLAQPTSPTWHTDTAFQQALRQPASVTWVDAPLRHHLNRLARIQRVAVFLDRRIDPSQQITFRTDPIPLGRLLQEIAQHVRADIAIVGSVVYIGPKSTAGKIGVVGAMRRNDSKCLPAAIARRLRAARTLHWDQLTEPHQLIAQLGEANQVAIDGLALVPHDLWPETDLPPLCWPDRMTLVLAGFNLTFLFVDRGRGIRLEPFPDQVPRAVSGTVSMPELLSRTSSNRFHNGDAETRYTMQVRQQPLGAVLKTIQQRAGLEFQFDSTATSHLHDRVTLQVRDVSLDELLRETLGPVGLVHRQKGRTVMVTATRPSTLDDPQRDR